VGLLEFFVWMGLGAKLHNLSTTMNQRGKARIITRNLGS
jgi:hypothetical protein